MPEKNIIVSVGGNLDSAVKGEYSVDVKGVLTEAWQQTLKSRMSINIALIGVFFFGVIISYIASSFFGGIELVFENPEMLQIINVVVTVAVWPFIAGIEMMGVYHAINRPTKSSMIFSFLNRGSWVALCALLTSLLISIGAQIFLIPGVILAVLLSLTIPLVVEKKMTPVQAVIVSVKALRFKLLPLLVIFFVLFMALVSLLVPIALLLETQIAPLGIAIFLFGLTYLAPWYYNVKGILYRDIFGVFIAKELVITNTGDESFEHDNELNAANRKPEGKSHTTKDSDHNGSDDTFSA
ncbi:hypothetical protein [Colwellia sp. E2M01]|uniref:hypothetical protein n=1 Tax=Colwellia sp. E2M01 TaxID=2841561 RepID=UPI001C087003|nr:hypothetical protein [Colwellia sp. E2M01]MBU2870924.1 hypothetical protein [Colwellia sp. E2M01]